LASHGFAVLIPSFDDSPFSAFDHADLAASLNALVDQALQPGQIFSQNIDPEHIGMGGHSRGGKAALLAAIQSPRPKAVCTLDPVDSLGSPFDNPAPTPENPSVTPELMGGLTVPSGYVGAGMGAEGIVPCAPKEDNYHEYYKAAATPAYEWLLEDAGHGDFAENGGLATQFCNSNADAQTVRNFSATTLVAFFQVYLGNAPAYQPWLDGDKLPANVALSTK
jgi:pimeloyl-ACP methyl ester carboxylesterase